jgi:hypothetical protein
MEVDEEVTVVLLSERWGETPAVTRIPAEEAELSARRAMRRQIAKLERELADAFVTAAPMGGLPVDAPNAAHAGRLLSLGELGPDDVIIAIDADGQHVPEEIPHAVAAMREAGVDMLIGQRDFSVYPPVKIMGNRLFTRWVSLLSGQRYTDVECGFRLLRTEVVPDVLSYCSGRKYSLTDEVAIVVPRCGWRVSNNFPTTVPYYRARARLVDGITNFYMGLLTVVKLIFRWQQPWTVRIEHLLQGVVHDAGAS